MWTLLLLLASPQEDALEGCRRCDFRGVVECTHHKDGLLELEQTVDFCSVAAECGWCAGSFLLPCKKCDGGPETAARLARIEEVRKWRMRKHEAEKHLERSLVRCEFPQFEIIFDVKELRDGRKKVDGHRLMHEMARDIHLITETMHGHYGVTEKNFIGGERLYFWERAEDHRSVMTKFLFSTSAGDFKMLGRAPTFSVHTHDEAFQGSAEAIHTLGVHNAVHMLLSNLDKELWIGDQRGGWFDAGAAHWYERMVFGTSINYCIDEATVPPNFEDGNWRPAIYKRLKSGRDSYLSALVSEQTGTLNEEQHAMAWSLYDWLVNQHQDRLRPLLNGFQNKQHSRDLFRNLLNMEMYQVEEQWREWVKEEYRKKEPKKRR